MVKIPVANHGLHKHAINKPWLGTLSFMDVCPVLCEPYYKAEKFSRQAGVLSRLNAITNPAFATGRFEFRGFFVPFKYVWRPWYYHHEGKSYHGNQYTEAPYCLQRDITRTFVNGITSGSDTITLLEFYDTSLGNDYDVFIEDDDSNIAAYTFTKDGRRLFRCLVSLGMSPTWSVNDFTPVNVLKPLCYIRLFLDYYFPRAYVGGMEYNSVERVLSDQFRVNYTQFINDLLYSLLFCCNGFYQNNVYDLAFDTPLGTNNNVTPYPVSINDNTNSYPYRYSTSASQNVIESVIDNTSNSNGTPTVISNLHSTSSTAQATSSQVFRLNKFILDSIESLSLWMKRKQLAGGRLLDQFLASRGMKLNNDSVELSYYLGKHDIEINVDAVENNSNDGLGELAGKGTASSRESGTPSFEFEAVDDGLFFVVCFVRPDCDQPVFIDPWNLCVNHMQFYHSEFDKLGTTGVPAIAINYSMSGRSNNEIKDANFGFLNQYYYEVNNNPVLCGDFLVRSAGARSLGSFNTFRLNQGVGPAWPGLTPLYQQHSFDFVKGANDAEQYNRLFYSGDADNIQLFIRWFGDCQKYKLPLGDSYDWDDDEFNQKVEISQKGF